MTDVKLPGRVRPPMVVLAVAMVAVAIIGSVVLFRASTHQRQVLELAVTVPQGQRLTQQDLRAAGISGGTSLATLPASDSSTAATEYATTTLEAGTLLTQADLTAQQVPAPGQLLVPVDVKQGQLPARGLSPGALVVVTPVPGSGTANAQAGLAQPVQATVVEASQPDANDDVTVDLLVQSQYATQVAAQASTGNIALLVAPAGER